MYFSYRWLLAFIFLISCSTPKVEDSSTVPAVVIVKKARNKNLKNETKSENPGFDKFLTDADFDTAVDTKKWNLISDSEGIQTYEKTVPVNGNIAFRSELMIPAPLINIATVLNDNELRKQWIDSLVEAHTVKKINNLERIEYNHTQVQWPFQDRDFVYSVNVRIQKNPKKMFITMKSVEDAAEPIHDKIVRGEILYSHYYLQEDDLKKSTLLVVEMSVDPQGEIPKWLVELAQKRWPMNTLKNMKNLATKADLVVSKEIEDYFNE